jgi:hypothetical protein
MYKYIIMVQIKYNSFKCGQFVFGVKTKIPDKVILHEYTKYYIEIGGKKKCINITITKNDPRAYLTGICYKPECAINRELPKGNDGTVVMLLGSLKYISEHYEYVKEFVFMDKSYIECINHKYISLAYFNLVKYGKTWYMSKFDAKPIDKDINSQIVNANNIFTSQEVKNELSYDEFFEKYIKLKYELKNKKYEAIYNSLKDIYETSNTYREFIININNKFGDCKIFTYWFDSFSKIVSKVELNDIEWTMPISICQDTKISKIKVLDQSPFTTKTNKYDFMDTLKIGGKFCP